MRSLSLLIIAISVFLIAWLIPSPHGPDFKISCNVCHSPKSWKLDKAIYSFNHDKTNLPLQGQHTKIDCKLCHPTLVFSEAKTECLSCHKDVHESSVGPECNRCHTPNSWLVEDITRVHQQSRFPLIGVHSSVDCNQCHKSETFLRFEVIGNECYSCHSDVYLATTQPNHKQSGFSTQCIECHSIYSQNWGTTNFNHNFFPLSKGHEGVACLKCHTSGQFTKISTECSACHLSDYNGTTNPNHAVANFPKVCSECHTTSPGWKPTSFNHNMFPLTQGHSINDCSKCHVNGNYTSTSADCFSCHQSDYNSTSNPNHQAAGFPTACSTCHTTAPGWTPASFDHSSFPLTQGHSISDCAKCHTNGNFTNVSKECISCHQANYNATSNPQHSALNFSTVCSQCHTTNSGWKPASYTLHDALSFPIYSGNHRGQWSSCIDCHANTSNYKAFSCTNCHEHNKAEMDSKHKGLANYSYISSACLQCHPRGATK